MEEDDFEFNGYPVIDPEETSLGTCWLVPHFKPSLIPRFQTVTHVNPWESACSHIRIIAGNDNWMGVESRGEENPPRERMQPIGSPELSDWSTRAPGICDNAHTYKSSLELRLNRPTSVRCESRRRGAIHP